jgi:bla regulator protein BlaR1
MESIIFKTLLHSLWQGVLLAVITAVIILLTTNSSARLRYNLFVGCMMLFVATVAGTFLLELSNSNAAQDFHEQLQSGPPQSSSSTVTTIERIELSPRLVDNLIGYLSRYSAMMVLVWLLIICAKSVRFIIDVRTLFQVKKTRVYAAGAALEAKVNFLSAKYGIHQKVKIMQSGLVQVPMVLGHLKPLILVPLGLVNGLSAEEVEAILSHELAHVKRRDYLVNLVQSMVEILFFFNPAVLWISNLIRSERENCCDDLAVSTTQTKVDYIRALVSCQEFANAVPAYAMALSDGKSNLVHRVQRLISARNQSLNKIEKAVLAVVLVSSIILSSAFSGKSSLKEAVSAADEKLYTLSLPGMVQDTSKIKKSASARSIAKIKQQTTIHKDAATSDAESLEPAAEHSPANPGQSSIYAQLVKDGLINADEDVSFRLDNVALTINGVKQSDRIFQSYKSAYIKSGKQTISYIKKGDRKSFHQHTVDADDYDAMGRSDSAQAASDRAAAAGQRAQQVALRAQVAAERAQKATQAVAVREQVTAQRAAVAARRAEVASQRAAIAEQRSPRAANAQAVQVEVPINVPISAKIQKEVEHSLAQAQIAQEKAAAAQVKARAAETKALRAQSEANRSNNMTNDLVAEGLIKNKANFKYKLNKDELIIDGKEQSAEVQRRYMKKYLKSPNQTITTTVKTD